MQYGLKWQQYGVTHLQQIFSNGVLHTFSALQMQISLPSSMQFYYLQRQHVIKVQQGANLWVQSPTPIFNYMYRVQ